MITIRNLNFSYSKKVPLFTNMNMELGAGHIYGLLGKNGAGKSTLLKNIAGLVFPDSGFIEVLGYRPESREVMFLQDICFIPEEFYLPSVKSDTYVRSNAVFYPNFNHDYFNSLIAEFEIPIQQKLGNMSYGQKKKYIISFGLASGSKLIIMDEPTNGLDIPSKTQFRKIMASAMKEDRCIIISTHQIRDLDNLIDSVIVLNQNKVVLNASIFDIAEKVQFRKQQTINDEVLYAESSLGGFHAMVPNADGSDSKVDLELLFNGVLTEKEKITNLIEA
ncbi:ABC transporter ATP-binding protein [Albibacterium profundi]|uniref:ABC transporter ATP-binding protein n=1 Tax=Albibacterium profundi TaxID=3134906 RepID=A0ABV5CE08_9SPHI